MEPQSKPEIMDNSEVLAQKISSKPIGARQLFIVSEFAEALRFIKCIIPYFSNNQPLLQEVKENLQQSTVSDEQMLILQNPLSISTKYYEALTMLHIVKYTAAKKGGPLMENKFTFDSVFFFATAISSTNIIGHSDYCQISPDLLEQFNPQIQTLVYQKQDGVNIDMQAIIQKEEELETFTESVFDDFAALSVVDEVVRPKATSMLDETEGITRIIDILESNVWTAANMRSLPKNSKIMAEAVGSAPTLNIHMETFNSNQGLRERYEKQLKQEKNEETECHLEEKQLNELEKNKLLKEDEKQTTTMESNENEKKKNEILVVKNPFIEQKENKDTKKEEVDEEEQTMEDFMKIFQQIKHMKETQGQLSDDQRKDRAEHFLMNLLEKFGIDEDEEDL